MLVQQMRRTGIWLFRRRGYLPLTLAPFAGWSLWPFSYPGGSHALDVAWELGCFAPSLAGLGVRVATVGCAPRGTSARSARRIGADALNTAGMCSVVRHPLYLANFVVFAGVLLFIRSWWLILGGSLAYWLYYERIMIAEGAFLLERHGRRFAEWAARTPAVVPRARLWRAPDLAFSGRSAIRREYTTLFLIVCVFTVVEVAGEYVVTGQLEFDPLWRAIFGAGLLVYVLVRALKKHTRLLDVEGR
jgi:protein-S-isoprenylcysteine O-methyltransferase Ste14